MTDDRLQDLMAQARESYRVPAEPPLDEMWARIEREHFDASVESNALDAESRRLGQRSWRRGWWAPLVAAAATLVIGVGIGRFTAASPDPVSPIANATPSPAAVSLLQQTTYEYLDETVTLLASLSRDGDRGDSLFHTRASQLLGTTRLLLDSPASTDPRLRNLLEDLELVLAQVARLRPAPRAEELIFIAEALDERDVVPRMRTVAAALSASDYH